MAAIWRALHATCFAGIVRHGFTGSQGSMPPVGDTWTQEEVDGLAAYVKKHIYKAAPAGATSGG